MNEWILQLWNGVKLFLHLKAKQIENKSQRFCVICKKPIPINEETKISVNFCKKCGEEKLPHWTMKKRVKMIRKYHKKSRGILTCAICNLPIKSSAVPYHETICKSCRKNIDANEML